MAIKKTSGRKVRARIPRSRHHVPEKAGCLALPFMASRCGLAVVPISVSFAAFAGKTALAGMNSFWLPEVSGIGSRPIRSGSSVK